MDSSRPDDTALALSVPVHVEITVVCDSKGVWRHFAQSPVCVHPHMFGVVDGQQLVWVDRDQNGACVCLQTEGDINHHNVCVSECAYLSRNQLLWSKHNVKM